MSASAVPETPGLVGARVLRSEDRRFLTGDARYLDDVRLPRMVEAAVIRSPHAHARIVAIDADAARALPGVVAVWSAQDFDGGLPPLNFVPFRPDLVATTQPLLADGRARYVGEPVAIVVAESRYVAEDAASLVRIEWEILPSVLDPDAALAPGAPVLDEAAGTNDMGHVAESFGDVEAAFARADHVFKSKFHVGRHAAMPLEPRGVIADWDATRGQMEVWSSTQIPHIVRVQLAPRLGIPESRLRVRTAEVGGGFGLKCQIHPEEILIPIVARRLRRPVKWVEDRYEHLASGTHSRDMYMAFELATTSDGEFLGIKVRYIVDGGAYNSVPYGATAFAMNGPMTEGVYRFEAVHWECAAPLTNKCPLGAYRGVGWAPGHTGREVLVDHVAHELGIDPAEIRRRNLIPEEPYETLAGPKYDGGSYRRSLERALEVVGYDDLRRRQAELREQGRYLGIGMSSYVEATGFGSRVSESTGFPLPYHDSASVAMHPDGTVVVSTGLHNHGQGHETTFAQVAADRLGVRIEDVRVIQGDTDLAPFGMGTFASRGAVIGTGSVGKAADDIRVKLLQLAGAALEADPDDLELRDGKAQVRGAEDRNVAIGELASMAYWGGDLRPDDVREEPVLTATRTYDPVGETYSNGTILVVLEVDPSTGVIEIDRVLAVEDCGTMLNPMIVEGQVSGAVVQGIGGAVLEDIAYSPEGELLTGTLAEYLYPTSTDVPTIEVEHMETPSPVTAGGVKGLGEGGTIGTPAAVVNAVADALRPLGVRSIDRTPLDPEYILELIDEAATREAA